MESIPPMVDGDDVIQGTIIKNLGKSDLVLCDMSILNPNVFYELGIRTALNKSVAIVRDEFTDEIDNWIIDELKAVGCDSAKSVLELTPEELLKRTDLEEETIAEIYRVLRAEFE